MLRHLNMLIWRTQLHKELKNNQRRRYRTDHSAAELLELRSLLTVIVPGTANPFLADPSVVPGVDPRDGTVPPSVTVTPGDAISFAVTGVTGNFPSGSFGPNADGIQAIYQNATYGAFGGISDYKLPLNSGAICSLRHRTRTKRRQMPVFLKLHS